MTATDELQAELTKRGVDWYEIANITYFGLSEYESLYAATEYKLGGIVLDPLTPEQAIAATLGDTDATCERHGDADERDQLKAENAKLRELVADMWRFTWTACKKYQRLFDPAAQGGQMVQPNMLDSFEQRMRELGVEVD